jgi:NAD(P)-dependent dehydrogenase (short-subunit alcohol dehydrogenase family)
MDARVVLVTGVTGAIGGAAARALASRGATVVLAARDSARLEALASDLRATGAAIETQALDLGDKASIEAAAAAIVARHPKLDAVVHVAAQYRASRVDVDGLEAMFAVNHLGPFRLTRALLPALRAADAPRVITVSAPSSTQLKWDDLQGTQHFSAFHAFGASKMANLLFAFELARREPKIASFAFHPGLVKSALMNDSPVLKAILQFVSAKPERAGEALADLALGETWSGRTGEFVHLKKAIKAPAWFQDPGNARRLWELSESY